MTAAYPGSRFAVYWDSMTCTSAAAYEVKRCCDTLDPANDNEPDNLAMFG